MESRLHCLVLFVHDQSFPDPQPYCAFGETKGFSDVPALRTDQATRTGFTLGISPPHRPTLGARRRCVFLSGGLRAAKYRG